MLCILDTPFLGKQCTANAKNKYKKSKYTTCVLYMLFIGVYCITVYMLISRYIVTLPCIHGIYSHLKCVIDILYVYVFSTFFC